MPTCLVVQHLEPEGPFAIAGALGASGVSVDLRRVFESDPVPAAADGFDGVVVMGGAMSARSDVGFPTRRAEIAMLAGAVEAGVPVLGVCLGAQLLAAACGARVVPGEAGPEIGWGEVDLTSAAVEDALLAGIGPSLPVLHWHGDTFTLPPGAVHLATSSRYRCQAFRVGPCAWGLQFHVEVDAEAVAGFIAAFGPEAGAAGVDPGAIAAATPEALARLEPRRTRLLGHFAGLVAARAVAGEVAARS